MLTEIIVFENQKNSPSNTSKFSNIDKTKSFSDSFSSQAQQSPLAEENSSRKSYGKTMSNGFFNPNDYNSTQDMFAKPALQQNSLKSQKDLKL
jgi:hypothetical protein